MYKYVCVSYGATYICLDEFLDIYNSVTVIASSQEDVHSPVWKAVDGSPQNVHPYGCYSSQPAFPHAYWRVELPKEAIVSSVSILRLEDLTAETMTGSSVHVGSNKTDVSSSYFCGNASSQAARHVATCAVPQRGRHVAIVAGNSSTSQLYLCEIHIYGCYGKSCDIS